MQRMERLCLLIVMLLLLSLTACAMGTPDVTEEEYRYYLEWMALERLDVTEIGNYDDETLRQKMIAAVEQEEPYRDCLEYMLWDGFATEYLSERNMGKFSIEKLEKIAAYAFAQEEYTHTKEELKDDYQITVPRNSTPQEIAGLYYRTLLQQVYGFTNLEDDTSWYITSEMYYLCQAVDALQQKVSDTTVFTNATLEELQELDRQLLADSLQQMYGIQQDISGYTIDELEELEIRLRLEQEARDYGCTGDLSGYSNDELSMLGFRLAVEKDIRAAGYDGDLSRYTEEELCELRDKLQNS